MKVGDKKQATILGAVAVGALGFLVIRMLPEKSAVALRTADAAASSNSAGTPATDLPLTLVNDPFSHPKLSGGPRDDEKGPDGKGAPGAGSGKPGGEVRPFTPHLDPEFWGMGSKVVPELPNAKPADRSKLQGPFGGPLAARAHKDEPKKREPIGFTLNAVISAGNATAYIAIGNGEPVSYEVGAKLPTDPPFRVAEIRDGSVVLAGDGKIATLKVGEKKDL